MDRYFQDNLPRNLDEDSPQTRAQRHARRSMLTAESKFGYAKLWSTGRLSEAGRAHVRRKVLEIASNDPDGDARFAAVNALRRYIAERGDTELLDALRRMRESETDSYARAAIDLALGELDPTTPKNLADELSRPNSIRLRRMLNQSTDPASSPWADAHSYIQSAPQRTTEQLIADYGAFSDPPADETGRQNATLKRKEAISELIRRAVRGHIDDLQPLKDVFVRAVGQEPDPGVRMDIISGLEIIAERSGRGVRAEIAEGLEKRLVHETHPYAKVRLEAAIQELKH
jgi:hypothetical protein